jgi:hypothetical protein
MPSLANIKPGKSTTTWERLHDALDTYVFTKQRGTRLLNLDEIDTIVRLTPDLDFIPGTNINRVLTVLIQEKRIKRLNNNIFEIAKI